jgi:BirA family biotin operon repressor/biotin-[acetyl-CoA-carboxylase] ligase
VLNLQKILDYISSSEIKSQINLQIFEELPSTNQKLWELLEQGLNPPLNAKDLEHTQGVIALQQSRGRGQWGRQWRSQKGGLYLSLALSPNIPVNCAAHLTLLSAWGITTALRQQNIPVLIKWPNDLILNGRKLGGILSETRIQQQQITLAVIGVGINWLNSVPEMGINLQSYPQITSLEKLAALTLEGIISSYQQYLSQGIENIVPSYTQVLYSRGKQVTIDGCQGVIEGVTSQGELMVRLHSKGASAEVIFPPGTISLGYD